MNAMKAPVRCKGLPASSACRAPAAEEERAYSLCPLGSSAYGFLFLSG